MRDALFLVVAATSLALPGSASAADMIDTVRLEGKSRYFLFQDKDRSARRINAPVTFSLVWKLSEPVPATGTHSVGFSFGENPADGNGVSFEAEVNAFLFILGTYPETEFTQDVNAMNASATFVDGRLTRLSAGSLINDSAARSSVFWDGRGSIKVATLGAFQEKRWSTSLKVTSNPGPLAVPEPATWATMILGFGLVGASIRRRRTAGPPQETLSFR